MYLHTPTPGQDPTPAQHGVKYSLVSSSPDSHRVNGNENGDLTHTQHIHGNGNGNENRTRNFTYT